MISVRDWLEARKSLDELVTKLITRVSECETEILQLHEGQYKTWCSGYDEGLRNGRTESMARVDDLQKTIAELRQDLDDARSQAEHANADRVDLVDLLVRCVAFFDVVEWDGNGIGATNRDRCIACGNVGNHGGDGCLLDTLRRRVKTAIGLQDEPVTSVAPAAAPAPEPVAQADGNDSLNDIPF